MATAYISTNTELSLVNTISQNLILFLPQNPINGRNLFIKDAAGNSFQSTITLSTLGTDTFENGSVLQTLNSAYESMQLTYNSNIWYFTGGMMFNTLRVSTLHAQTTQTSNLSTLNVTVSSFQISDVPTSSIGTFNSVSSFLFYNGFNIGGGLRTAIPQTLNRFRFSLFQIIGLLLWIDTADSSTIFKDTAGTQRVTTNGDIVRRINDKSGNSYNVTTATTTNIYTTAQQNGNSSIQVPTSSGFATVPFIVSATNTFSLFVVVMQNTIGPNTSFFRNNNNNNAIMIQLEAAQTRNTANNTYVNNPAFLTNVGVPNIYSTIFDATTVSGYFNGTFNGSATGATGALLATSLSPHGIAVNGGMNGYLYEVILFNRFLNTIQRQQTEGYLAWKWGIQSQLPATHPFRNAPPQ